MTRIRNPNPRQRPQRSRTLSRTLKVASALLAVTLYLAYAPDHYNLARPLELTHPPTIVNDFKLRVGGVDRCYQALARAGIELERLPDEVKGPGCGFEDVSRLDQSFLTWGDGITLTCHMLAGITWWEYHSLQPIARELFGSPVQRVRHFGTYSCRNVNNAASGRRSEHATANAVDVAGFVLADGREISVLKDWGEASPEGRFLERIHDRACDHFDTVLGPNYNDLHRDHFHFDNGGYETCR